jgi:hypothetical protein
MAEPFGIVSGAVGIAAVFTTCVDCFGYVQLGRHFGKDYQTNLIALNILRLRLSRWGEAVDVYVDPKLGNPMATPAAVSAAKDALLQILILFADSEKTAKKFRLTAGAGDLNAYSSGDMSIDLLQINNKMAALAKKRQKQASFLKLSSWALYHGEEFTKLTDNITKLLDLLENLFPAPEAQGRLIEEEAAVLKGDVGLEILVKLAAGIDRLLQQRATMEVQSAAPSGLVVHELVTADKVRLHAGDAYSNDWTGNTGAQDPRWSHIDVGKMNLGGESRAQVGTKFGGKDIFDD